MSTAHILVVEDDLSTCELYTSLLKENDYQVNEAHSLAELNNILSNCKINLVLLDINLPDGNAMSAIKEIREKQDAGIIVITARVDEGDKLISLELGADEYLIKPVNPRELLVRTRNMLTRIMSPHDNKKTSANFESFSVDLMSRNVFLKDGEKVELTNSEFELLHIFITHSKRALSRKFLVEAIRREDVFDRTIDTLVARLRKKLKLSSGDVIKTIHGHGYKFDVDIS